jgi:hypothetical protein
MTGKNLFKNYLIKNLLMDSVLLKNEAIDEKTVRNGIEHLKKILE